LTQEIIVEGPQGHGPEQRPEVTFLGYP
jgi:hypothetical protein